MYLFVSTPKHIIICHSFSLHSDSDQAAPWRGCVCVRMLITRHEYLHRHCVQACMITRDTIHANARARTFHKRSGLPGRHLIAVGKKELSYVPVFGWLMYLGGHIIVDRNKSESALASMKRCACSLFLSLSLLSLSLSLSLSHHFLCLHDRIHEASQYDPGLSLQVLTCACQAIRIVSVNVFP